MNQHPNQQNQAANPPIDYNIVCLGSGYTAGITAILIAYFNDVVITMFDVDVDNEDMDDWVAGIVPFEEPNYQHMFNTVRNVRLMIGHNNNIGAALQAADFIIMAIDNPSQRVNKKDLLDLTKWSDSWKKVAMHASNKLVIEKSNLPFDVDTKIIQIFRQHGQLHDPIVVYNPDFYSLGTAFDDLYHNPKQVIFGGNAQVIHEPMFSGYRQLLHWVNDNIVFEYQDLNSVILAKLGINGLLASKLSILNTIASISAAVKADMSSIMEIMHRDQRLGPTYLTHGIGFGGPSLKRDTQLLGQEAENCGQLEGKQIFTKVVESNEAAAKKFVNMIVDKMIGATNNTIAIFGVASKHGISDLTNSPAIEVCKLLVNHGVNLRIFDRHVLNANILENFRIVEQQRIVVATSPVQAATNASAICLLTDCDAYQHGGQFYNQLFAVMAHPSYIFNGRQNSGIIWQDVANIGFSIHAVGWPSRGLGFE